MFNYGISREGAIYTLPGSAGANGEAIDTLICCVAGSINDVIVAESGVKGNGYIASKGW